MASCSGVDIAMYKVSCTHVPTIHINPKEGMKEKWYEIREKKLQEKPVEVIRVVPGEFIGTIVGDHVHAAIAVKREEDTTQITAKTEGGVIVKDTKHNMKPTGKDWTRKWYRDPTKEELSNLWKPTTDSWRSKAKEP